MGDGNSRANADVGSSSACFASRSDSELDWSNEKSIAASLASTSLNLTSTAAASGAAGPHFPCPQTALAVIHSDSAHGIDWDLQGGKKKMNVITSAVLSGVLYFARGPAYPHPLPVVRVGHSQGGASSCGGGIGNGGIGSGTAVKDECDSAIHSPGMECDPTARKVAPRLSMIPELPPELYSVIASHLFPSSHNNVSEDKRVLYRRALASCALVSAAWLSASRPYLFDTVKLTYTNITSFLELLRNPLCSFKLVVRVVKMREGEFMVDRWMDRALPKLLASLQTEGEGYSMRVLDMYNLTWQELGRQSVETLQKGFQGVESLRVGTCYFECVHEFASFVCSSSFHASGLKHFVCDYVLLNCTGAGPDCDCGSEADEVAAGVDPDDKEEEEASRNTVQGLVSNSSTSSSDGRIRYQKRATVPGRLCLPKTLESLYLSLPEESMLWWFADQETAYGLKRLGVSVRDSASVELVSELVSKAGSALEELVLSLPSGCPISLSQNTSLRTLHLRIPPLWFDASPLPFSISLEVLHNHTQSYLRYQQHILQALRTLISSISSPSIHTLTFDVDTTALNSYNPSIWRLLNRHVFEPLRNTAAFGSRRITLDVVLHYEREAAFEMWKHEIQASYRWPCQLEWNVEVRGMKVTPCREVDEDEEMDADTEDGWRKEGVGEVWRSWIE
ncbi:hypothetical protein D9756_010100 [Leucocoprinus leucothites]|uniref:Uncharacterized protein n=1 Tax=Leucocoprinus leucothites TaxID=201217 RepID=A0A8H5CRH0_9AGAR|nr:hypothetical protein D9756_010100 [Leucoagaricus leucothites]